MNFAVLKNKIPVVNSIRIKTQRIRYLAAFPKLYINIIPILFSVYFSNGFLTVLTTIDSTINIIYYARVGGRSVMLSEKIPTAKTMQATGKEAIFS